MRAVTRTALAAAIVLGGLAGGLPSSAAEARRADSRAEWRTQECRYQSLDRGTWTAREEYLTARCAVGKWSVPGGLSTFVAIADCESGWNRFASNGGSYLGLFQHAAADYIGRVLAYEPPAWDRQLSTRWTNSRGQIVMTARMAHASGWGAWSCA